MNDGYAWWLILVGIGVGLAVAWLLVVRLPRSDEDVSPAERRAEAAWISQAIGQAGGYAPPLLVEEVLELHGAYLRRQEPAAPRRPPPTVEPTGRPPR